MSYQAKNLLYIHLVSKIRTKDLHSGFIITLSRYMSKALNKNNKLHNPPINNFFGKNLAGKSPLSGKLIIYIL